MTEQLTIERLQESPSFQAVVDEALARDADAAEERRAEAARRLAEIEAQRAATPPREVILRTRADYARFAGVFGLPTAVRTVLCPPTNPAAPGLRAAIRANAPEELRAFRRELIDLDRAICQQEAEVITKSTGWLNPLTGRRVLATQTHRVALNNWLSTVRGIRTAVDNLIENYMPRSAVLVEIDRLKELIPLPAVKLLPGYRARQRADIPAKWRSMT